MTRFVKAPVFGRPRRHTNFFLSKAATGDVSLTAPKLSSTSVLYGPSIKLDIVAPKIDTASVLRTHTVTPVIAVTAPKLASTSTLYSTSVSFSLTAPLLSSASVLRTHSVTPVIELTAPKIDSTSVLRATSVSLTLGAPKIDSTSVLYDHEVSGDIDRAVSAPKLASTSTLYAPSLSLVISLTAPFLASTSALYGPSIAVDTGEVPVEPPATVSGGGGGGSSGHWYRGKYRHEIKKAIRRALADLDGVRSSRSRKRRVRRIASAFVQDFTFDAPLPVIAKLPDIAPLEPIRLRLLQIGEALREKEIAAEDARAKTREMEQLFAEYEREVARIEQNEEEEAMALILAIAA